ncbi:hypothetical protein F0365_09240 [Nonlabens sp. Ci31]|jgi:hypothetical protein|uniref:hypothetical protein n=1 Tax=Nonlabens sp. Ci31 TaxID=2608253 RepID=UPI001463EDF9|nr:hypothetical protein [Nonlabens sp. Ci31]QJP34564.1 hypothetical protein F0365_09240 [Nonlabens sp. Ci31]
MTLDDVEIKSFYNFKSDGTYSCSFSGENIITNQFLGFKGYEEGTYSAENAVIKIKLTKFLIAPNGEYVALDQLEESQSGNGSFSYEINKEILLELTPICGPYEDCTGALVYHKIIL